MKKLLFTIVIFSSIVLFAQDIESEKKAIQHVIQTAYVEGLQNEGDIEKIDSGIHPDFKLLGIGEDNSMWELPITDWKQKVIDKKKAGKLPAEDEKKVTIKFLSIDITGTAAVAKIEFYVGKKLKYIDYISLYKFEDGWKMVNKIFYKL